MQIIEIVKSHPVPFAIGAVVLLLLVSRSGSTQAAQSNGSALAQASMANNTQLATINAGTSVQLGAQASDRFKAAQDAATTRAGITAGMFDSLVNSNASVSVAMAGVNAGTVQKAIDAANAREAMNLSAQVQQSQITAGITTAANNLAGTIQMHLDDNNAKLNAIGLTTQGQLDLLAKGGEISTNQLGMNLAAQATSLPMILQSTENMARITGSNQLAVVRAQTKAANTTAQANKNKSDWGIVGNVIGSIASFF